MSFATDMFNTAYDLLDELGQSISVTRNAYTFTPSTGAVGSASTTSYTGVGYPTRFAKSLIDGNLVKQSDTLLLFCSSTVPAVGDIFTVGSKVHTALAIEDVAVQGSDVLYKVQLRQ